MKKNINKLVAINVMGWKPGPKGVSAGLWTGPGCDGRHWNHGPDQWSPSTDPAAMMVVVEKMGERGWWAKMITPFVAGGRYGCGFCPLGVTGWNGKGDHEGNGDTLPLAVCLASLRAVGVPEAEIQAAMGERSEA